jgi:hypothetical protein
MRALSLQVPRVQEKHKRRLKRRRKRKQPRSAQRQLADAQKRGKQLVTVSAQTIVV